MGTPNYYQESREILLEILLEKLLSTQAGNRPNTLLGQSPVADIDFAEYRVEGK